MNRLVKSILFRFYPITAIIVLFVSVVGSVAGVLSLAAVAAMVGSTVSFAFAVQRQHIEETRLFRELFEQFNARYDRLNERLNAIYYNSTSVEAELTEPERDVLFNYFNLCGEEFLYYREGFIHEQVWASWMKGMQFFRENPRIRYLWNEELQSGSYYGLNFKSV